ncbi:hypothetical protein [Streptomyces sp. NPDC047928]|uniref:hypothetical protein n=1 Tax=unclassified Streptomyces TaxID=2593676 RepID=UPI003719325A
MGSLRNPVGPLPSSIYWRRRAVAASLAALLAVLIVWLVTSGGDGPDDGKAGAGGTSPAPSITPGPSGSGPAISTQPGGRDEPGDSGASDGGEGTDAGGDGGKNGDSTSAGGTGGGGTGNGNGGGTGAAAGQQVPAGSPLPDCAPGAVRLTLRSAKVDYAPGEKPRLELVAKNTSGTTCKTDLGPATAVLTIKDDQAERVWSSKDCPSGSGSVLVRVPAGGTATYTHEWDRRPSEPRCATPAPGAAGPGTYLVEATVPGVKVLPASFTLAKD